MENDRLLQPGEAAQLLGVDPKTLIRWANAKKIPYHRTLGGHRRYRLSVIDKILSDDNN
jgi:excisionase family DNA binding protein